MVEKFEPVFVGDAEPAPWNESALDELIAADKPFKIGRFIEDHPKALRKSRQQPEMTARDIEAARCVLLLAIQLLNLKAKGTNEITEFNFGNCARLVIEERKDGGRDKYLHLSIPNGLYFEYLKAMMEDAPPYEIATDAVFGGTSLYATEYVMNSDRTQAEFYCDLEADEDKYNIEYAIDCLFTLHLSHLMTLTRNGGEEVRHAWDELTMIWWLAMDRLRNGRAGICEECGTPFIAKRERGKLRRFCSKACQKRSSRRKKDNPAR